MRRKYGQSPSLHFTKHKEGDIERVVVGSGGLEKEQDDVDDDADDRQETQYGWEAGVDVAEVVWVGSTVVENMMCVVAVVEQIDDSRVVVAAVVVVAVVDDNHNHYAVGIFYQPPNDCEGYHPEWCRCRVSLGCG